MGHSSGDNLNYLPIIFLVAYAVVGSLALRRWFGPSRQRRPPSIHVDPRAWLSSWLPQLIVFEAFVMVGAVAECLLLLFTTGMAHSADALYVWLGFGIGLVFFTLFFAGFDLAMVARVRAMSRSVR